MRALFWLVCCCCLAGGAAAQQPPAAIDGPGVKVGDTWMYNTLNGWTGELNYVSVNAVTEIDKQGIVMESASLDRRSVSTVRRTRDFNLISIEAPAGVKRVLPYYPNFEFPLVVGKTWKRKVDFFNSQEPDKNLYATLEGKVVGWESVTVPAGTFRALKIVVTGWYRAQNNDYFWIGKIEDALWYAPEVRNAVRYEYKDTQGSGSRYNHDVHELVRYWIAP
jgi:hypothetical protein